MDITSKVEEMVFGIFKDLQDEYGITDGAEPFDSKLDELMGALGEEIERVVRFQIAFKEMEEQR